MLLHWIWLAHRPGVYDREKALLLRSFRDPEEVFYADREALDYIEGLRDSARESLQNRDLEPARKILADCEREKLHILTYQDAAYPPLLKNIADPPLVLYYKGQMPDFGATAAVAVVGTRKASAYGLTTAKRMGYQIARCGGLLVSGMAAGIDAEAMSGALSAGGAAVGVLGCGADVVYPKANWPLYRDVEAHGCIFSEFAPGTPPAKWTFPKRNRVISGMCHGVLVVEAPERSGALITANQAAEQGRDVFVVPGNIDQASCVGSNRLLRDGAVVVSSGWDILSEYAARYPDKIRRDEIRPKQTAREQAGREEEKSRPKPAQTADVSKKSSGLKKKLDPKTIDKKASGPYSDVNASFTGDEKLVVDALKNGERQVDQVIAETGMTTGRLLAALTILELKGVVRRLPGKRIALRQG